MVLATKALLDVNPDPTDEEICEALKNNYCRCTGYVKIIEAVHLAAARLRGEDPSVDDMRTWENLEIVKYEGEDDVTAQDLTGRHIGRCAIDIDGPAKVTGALPFTCDRADADTLYGAFVWSQHSRAKILAAARPDPAAYRRHRSSFHSRASRAETVPSPCRSAEESVCGCHTS